MGCSHFVMTYWFKGFADLNEGWFPKGKATPFDSLAELKRANPNRFPCSHFANHAGMGGLLIKTWQKKETFTENSTCYRYNEGLRIDDPRGLIVLYYFKPSYWQYDSFKGEASGRSLFYIDSSHIDFLPESEFQKRQEATLKFIKDNNRVSPEKYKMLEEQYRKTLGEGK